YAPHGVFGCAGDDQWVALAAPDDAAWAAAARVLGGPELAAGRFATAAGRLAGESDLEAEIGARTAGRDKRELAGALAAAGVIAAPVLDVGAVLADAGLAARGVRRPVTHPLAGEAIQAGLPLRTASTALPPWGAAPQHGEHSREVLEQELGLSEEAYAALAAAGITGRGPVTGN
ncbi:MAG TPA: CoA transferase, partial [Streptosporangiaceae bacterium]